MFILLIEPIELAFVATFKAFGLVIVAVPDGLSLDACDMPGILLLCAESRVARPDRVIVADDLGAAVDDVTIMRCWGCFRTVAGLRRADGRAGIRDEGILDVEAGAVDVCANGGVGSPTLKLGGSSLRRLRLWAIWEEFLITVEGARMVLLRSMTKNEVLHLC